MIAARIAPRLRQTLKFPAPQSSALEFRVIDTTRQIRRPQQSSTGVHATGFCTFVKVPCTVQTHQSLTSETH